MIEIIPNLHPLTVHFPIAFSFGALLCGVISKLLHKSLVAPYWASAARIMFWLFAVSALVAGITGYHAYNLVNHDDAGHAAMNLHRMFALPAIAMGMMIVAVDAAIYKLGQAIDWLTLTLMLLVNASILTTAWLGAEVVYRHGIGVLSLPEITMEHGHHHSEIELYKPHSH